MDFVVINKACVAIIGRYLSFYYLCNIKIYKIQ